MKKRVKIQAMASEAKAMAAVIPPKGRERKTGPSKEKVQVTLRLNQELMKAAYAQMKDDNMRLTELIERGLRLAVREAEYLPKLTGQIRFVLANATREQERLIRGLAIAMVEDEVREKTAGEIYEEKLLEILRWFLESRNTQPHALQALEVYSRYGKSGEEIGKLG